MKVRFNYLYLLFFTLIVFTTSCNKEKSVFYIDESGVIHADKKCDKIKKGIILVDNEKITKAYFCGKCVSKKQIEICTTIIELNKRRIDREMMLRHLAIEAKSSYINIRKSKKSIESIINEELKKQSFLEQMYEDMKSGYIKIGWPHNDLKELLKLDKKHFVARILRWNTIGITGLEEELEFDLDEDYIKTQEIIDKCDSTLLEIKKKKLK